MKDGDFHQQQQELSLNFDISCIDNTTNKNKINTNYTNKVRQKGQKLINWKLSRVWRVGW